MSRRSHSSKRARRRAQAPVFAALGDETRLRLVAKLAGGKPRSIAQLTKGSRLTRQAITKHLRMLEKVKIVHSIRAGRESRFQLDPRPMEDAREYLNLVSQEWDLALTRLKAFVER